MTHILLNTKVKNVTCVLGISDKNVDESDEVKENISVKTTFTNYERSMWTPLDLVLFIMVSFL